MVFDVVKAFQGAIRYRITNVDNAVCKLHYRITTLILIIFSILVTSKQYFGDPIDCLPPDEKTPANALDQYCWSYSTYTVHSGLNSIMGRYGQIDIAGGHPNINPMGTGKVSYHKYYQWVCFMLFLQAIMFYIPHYIWKVCEGGRVKSLVSDLNTAVVDDAVKENRLKRLKEYFQKNLRRHTFYFWAFTVCELLNFIHIIGQIYFTDLFLGGVFTTFGIDVVSFSEQNPNNRTDPLVDAFPRVTMCDFYKYGPGPRGNFYNVLCVLPVNIINEKIYIFLWFWFVLVAVITGVGILYRIVMICCRKLRFIVFRWRHRRASSSALDRIFRSVSLGDWFILQLLGKNIEPNVFKEFISQLAKNVESDGNDVGDKYELKSYA